jgi:hypothetical protein
MKKLTAFLLVFAVVLVFPAKILAANAVSQSNSAFSTPSSPTPVDGTTTASITITLRDSGNSPIVGDQISLTTSDNSAAFNNSQTTNSNGNATFTMTSTNVGTDSITVNITDPNNSGNNTSFANWFNVTFYSATAGCSSVPAAPVLNSVTSNSDHQATLTWTDSANPVSNYLISYGITSGSYIYGDPNVGNQGITTFTIGSLAGNKKYYFVVGASNNCGASAFSNEMSVVAEPVSVAATPVPTVKPTATPETLVTVSNPSPTDTPEENTETPTPEPAVQSGGINFKNLAIIFIVSGVVIIGLVIFLQKRGKKNPPTIPPMPPPNIPPNGPPFAPPFGEGPQQQQNSLL